MRKQTKQQRIEQLEGEVRALRAGAERFAERLNEARRRTVPLRNGDSDVSFLPLYVTKMNINRDIKEWHSASGWSGFTVGKSTATIECDGDIVMSPNKSTPVVAVPQRSYPDSDT